MIWITFLGEEKSKYSRGMERFLEVWVSVIFLLAGNL